MKKVKETIGRSCYLSPAVKVLRLDSRMVLCGSINGTDEYDRQTLEYEEE